MIIETERLILKPVSVQMNETALKQGYNSGSHIDLYLGELEKDQSQQNWGPWFVMLKVNGQIIGDIGFKGRPAEERMAEIGYGFVEEYRNQGFATESARALIDWSFKTNEVQFLVAETANDNLASIRVLEKLGMEKIYEANGMIYWQLLKEGIHKGLIIQDDQVVDKEL